MPTAKEKKIRHIVEVATKLFAEKGYAAVSVREICQALDVNLATISYYFGGKKKLYLYVLRSQFFFYEKVLDKISQESNSATEELRLLFKQVHIIHETCPWLSVIATRESCAPSEEFCIALREHEQKYNGGHIINLIRRAQKEGSIDSSIDPFYLSRIFSMLLNSFIIVENMSAILEPDFKFNLNDYFATVSKLLSFSVLLDS
ncbi:TetR/AcrR family transcriptional regulator [Desulfovibrio sp. 86]|uniref:Putative Regulatory protein TetR n=1 Tax=uncultured Desulfovibrio sp. TaxID=167968 RepID=A0A212L287_9BACT|nr:TetR/AcrR family transcriptional regulator [Desulfovibrio sp. 86]SCM71650.1 putative Regulatory protein TetR [uncultured Desulfovibrio sp.]VZH33004.1 putative Regulatory protein TetR [Desulfovibrio sp. 86]